MVSPSNMASDQSQKELGISKDTSPLRIKNKKNCNKDLNKIEGKKISKNTSEHLSPRLKQITQAITSKHVDGNDKILSTLSSDKIILFQKHVPIYNPDPNSYTSILKTPNKDNVEQNKQLKVVIDENLNSEHQLTNSDISYSQLSYEKKANYTENLTTKTVSSQKQNDYYRNTTKCNQNFKEFSNNQIKPHQTENISKKNRLLINKNDNEEKETKEPKIISNHSGNLTLYNQITKLGYTPDDENVGDKNTFYTSSKNQEQEDPVCKYALLSIEEWRQRGDDINSERSLIIEQIISLRVRSSYAHQILTNHLNDRAAALEAWGKKQQLKEEVISQIQIFLENKN
ncbi:hypothetical protein QEN19_001081 [Hanseniaspora menglaensis]